MVAHERPQLNVVSIINNGLYSKDDKGVPTRQNFEDVVSITITILDKFLEKLKDKVRLNFLVWAQLHVQTG